jgi:hypothetical protein
MADGYVIALNFFDNQIYCLGKGPSKTTVEAPMAPQTLGEGVVIRGTVTDDTATGRRNTNDMFEFTLQGTPAISDEDMSAWMEYMFMQQAKPTDVEGVEVVITTTDPNGNTYELTRTTSDENGEYACLIEPPVPGKYKLMACFEGSKAYGPSSASAYLWVEEAPSPAQPIEPEAPEEPTEEPEAPTAPEEPAEEPTEPEAPTEPEEPETPTEPEPTEPAEAPLITTELAIIIAVVVVAVIGVAAYWMLRKRK